MAEHLILSKVQYLFNVKLGIVFHDTRPENYLLSKMGHLVLTDFGLSVTALGDNGCTNTLCGTLDYMVLEIF
ncbi:Ribosomal protein S6 kinase beta-2, partial [Coemansia sp. RSA 2708]